MATVLLASTALADPAIVAFDIASQPLVPALKAFAEQANMQLVYRHEAVESVRANTLIGSFEKHEALQRLLRGTGLEIIYSADDVATIRVKRYDGSLSRTSMPGDDLNAQDRPEQAGALGVGRAQDTGSESAPALEEVVVTAQHRTEKLYDVPMGITALSGDSLDRRQERSFEDYAALVPGLSLTQGAPGENTLTLRGLNAGGMGSTVSVYVDDSPVGSSSSLANGSSFASNFDTWDMQRIEVLRGPQGTLYGASSEGGLIRFVTNAPDTTAFAGLAEVGGEGITRGSQGWSGKLMVNVPLSDSAAFRLSGYTESLPGYVDNPLLHTSNINSGKKNGLRASLLLRPTSDLTIRLTAFRQEIKVDGNPNVDVDNDTRQPVYGAFTAERVIPEPNRFTYDHYNATLDWNLGWASALSSTTYGKNSNRLFNDFSLAPSREPGLSASQLFSQALGAPLGYSLTNQSEVKKLTQELRLQSPSDVRLEWEVGAYFTRETAELYQANNLFYLSNGAFYGGQPGAYGVIVVDSLYKEWAGFATLTHHINSKVDVQIGARWAHNDQNFSQLEQVNIPPPFQFTNSGVAAAGKFLYSFAPRWHVTDDLMLYARIASGYQAGGPNPQPFGAPPGIPSQFFPDSTVNYEVGVRDRLFDQRVSIDLTAFRIDWSKVQITANLTTQTGNSYGYVGNGGKATSQGLEWALALAPLPDLTLSLTGAYIDAKLTTAAPAVGGVAGQRLPGSPEWSSSLDGEYGHHAFADYRAFAGATWSYTGTQFTNFSATPSSFLPPTRLAGYTTFTLRAGLQNERWRFSLYAKNVTNKQAIEVFQSSGAAGFPGVAIYTQPRTIGATASFKF